VLLPDLDQAVNYANAVNNKGKERQELELGYLWGKAGNKRSVNDDTHPKDNFHFCLVSFGFFDC